MKRLLTILVSLLLLLSLSACHGAINKSGFVVPEQFDESKNYEITFWAKNDSNINQVNVYKKAIEDFENLYPNIKVNLVLYTDYTKIYNDVITNISTNTTPNVCITYPDHIATYITGQNTVTPLNDLLTDANYGLGGSKLKFDGPSIEEMIPRFLNEGYIGNTCYAIPFMRSTEALYINKTYVEELGYEVPDWVTWDYIFEVSEAALKKDADGNFKINGQNIMIPFIYKSTDNMLISLLKQLDADYSNENGEVLIFNDTTKDVLLGLSEHVKTGAFSTFKIAGYPANFLNAGQCIFAIDSTAGSTWMGSNAPLVDIPEDKLVQFETVVRPIPQYDIDNPKMISQGPSICIFNKEDNNETLASWLFAQFLLSNDVQINYSKTEGYLPVTEKANTSKEYKEYLEGSGKDDVEHYSVKIDTVKMLMDNIDNTFVTPVFNGSASLRSAATELIEETCKGVRRNKNVNDEFIKELYENTNSLYRLDQIGGNISQRDLGPMPTGSKVLLGSLVAAWALIGAGALHKIKKKKDA